MAQSYEIWRSDDSITCLGVPHPDRGQVLNEPGASLLLRFDAEDCDEAREIKDRFCYGGNPDGQTSLNLPAAHFVLHRYSGDFATGELLTLKESMHLASGDNFFSAGTVFELLPGDAEFPTTVWMRVVKSNDEHIPIGRYLCMPLSRDFRQMFDKSIA